MFGRVWNSYLFTVYSLRKKSCSFKSETKIGLASYYIVMGAPSSQKENADAEEDIVTIFVNTANVIFLVDPVNY